MSTKKNKNHELVIKLFETSLSAREKKIVRSDLFGEGYPQDDLSPEMCLSIVAKLRPSVRQKLKPFQLMPHLSRHYNISEQDQIDIVDTTLSEGERASKLLDSINIKSSFPLAAFYIALIDSSNEDHGPPTHYQLACEMKRIVQEKMSEVKIPVLTDQSLLVTSSRDHSLYVVLDNFIKKLRGVFISQEQATELARRLGIEKCDELNCDLSEMLIKWKEKKGMWVTLYDITESIVLTRGIGHYVKLINTLPYPQLKNFLEGLKDNWIEIALFLGLENSDIELIVNTDTSSVSAQLEVFLHSWTLPDCGEKTGAILHKLRSAAMTHARIQRNSDIQVTVSTSTINTMELLVNTSTNSALNVPVCVSSMNVHVPVIASTQVIPSTYSMDTSSSYTLDGPVMTTTAHNSVMVTKAMDIVLTTVDRSLPLNTIVSTSSANISSTQSLLMKTERRQIHNTAVLKPDPGGGGQPVVFFDRSKNSDPTTVTDSSYELPSQEIIVKNKEKKEEFQTTTTTTTNTTNSTTNSTNEQTVWPSPIQQSNKSVTLPYTHTTSNVHFTAPVSTTIPTWSGSLQTSSSHVYVVTSRSSPEDSLDEDEVVTKSLPPNFPPYSNCGPPTNTATDTTGSMNLEPDVINEMSTDETKEEKEEDEKGKKQNEEEQDEEEVEDKEEMEEEVIYESIKQNKQKDIQTDTAYTEPIIQPITPNSTSTPTMITTTINNVFIVTDLIQSLYHDDVNDFKLHCQRLDNPIDDINRKVPLENSQDGNYLIHITVKLSKINHVATLLDFGANIDQIDEKRNGISSLHIASENGDKKMIELLLNRRATVDIRDENGSTPLLFLLLTNIHRLDCIKLLLQSGANIGAINNEGITPLVLAVVGESNDVVQLLLESDASHDVINYARKCKAPSGELNWITPLADAAARGNLNIVKLLIEKGANLNSTGEERKPPCKGRREEGNYISPLLLPCANNHVNVVEYITQQPQFICQIPYIADPLIEALTSDNLECAQLIWEKYEGGIVSLLAYCHDDYPQLKELLGKHVHVTVTPDITVSNDNKSDASSDNNDNTTNDFSALEDNDETTINITNLYSVNTFNDLSDVEETGNAKGTTTVTMNDFNDFDTETSASTEKHQPLSSNTSSRPPASSLPSQQLNRLSVPPDSSSLPQLNTLSDPPRSSTPLQLSTHSAVSSPQLQLNTLSEPPSLPQLNRLSDPSNSLDLPLQLSDSPRSLPPKLIANKSSNSQPLGSASTPSKSFHPTSLPPLSTASKLPTDTPMQTGATARPTTTHDTPRGATSMQTGATPIISEGATPLSGGGMMYDSATDTDNPFEPRLKTPPLRYSDDDRAHQPTSTVEVSGNLRNFQTSAVEVLYDFAQYFIQACLQKHTQEEIIAKAEEIEETGLVHFFTTYFYEITGAVRGGEFVTEFIKGFPSPLNFIISTRLCTKTDFMNVLREMGREDFIDQLMLALHQFQDSDNIPWDGSELLNGLFYQHFSIGTPYPIVAMQERIQQAKETTLQRQLTQDHSAATSAVTSEEKPFPGIGRKLGGNALDGTNFTARTDGEDTNTNQDSKKIDVPILNMADKDQTGLHDISTDSRYNDKFSKPVEQVDTTHDGLEEELKESMETNDLDDMTTMPLSTQRHTVTDTSGDEGDTNTLPINPLLPPVPSTTIPQTIPSLPTVIQSLPPRPTTAKERLSQLMKSSTDSEDELLPIETAPMTEEASKKVMSERELIRLQQESTGTLKERKTSKPTTTATKTLSSRIPPSRTDKSPKVVKKVPAKSPSTSPKLPLKEGSKKTLSSSAGCAHETAAATIARDKRRQPTVQSTTITDRKTRAAASTIGSKQSTLHSKITPSTAAGRNIMAPSTSTATTKSKVLPAVRSTRQTAASEHVSSPSLKKRTVMRKSEQPPPTLKLHASSSSPTIKSSTIQRTEHVIDHSRQYDIVHASTVVISTDIKQNWLRKFPVPRLKEKLPETKIEDPFSLFKELARSLPNWKMLGRYLGLKDEDLTFISKLGSDSNNHTMQMFELWSKNQSAKTTTSNTVTYKILGEALVNCMKDELIVILIEHSQTPFTVTKSDVFELSPATRSVSELSPATRSVSELSHQTDDTEYEMIMTLPINRVLSAITPMIEDEKEKGKVSKVTVSLKFHS